MVEQTRRSVWVRELVPEQRIEEVCFLVAEATARRTRHGDRYLCLRLGDRTGQIEGRVWQGAEALEEWCLSGQIARIWGEVQLWQEDAQIRVDRAEPVGLSEVELTDLLPSSRWDPAAMLGQLEELIFGLVRGEGMRRLLLATLGDRELMGRFVRAPAASRYHHGYVAGLMEHTLSMARIAALLLEHYEAYYPGMLDRDLVIAGCLFHDLGKIEELEVDPGHGGFGSYTTRGRLVGHVVRGAEIAARIAASLAPPPDAALIDALRHLILSHHGKLEHGAPVRPQMPEAILLHHIDLIDSRMNMCSALIDGLEPGGWSEYSRPLEGRLYRATGAIEALEPQAVLVGPGRAVPPASWAQAAPQPAGTGAAGFAIERS